MPKVIIDGTEYEVSPGRSMLEAALDHGLNLPYFCWHPAMGSVGACRLCAVRVFKDENDTKGKIQMACMTQALDGTRISMNDPEAAEFRRYVIEWLMTNHPHDCPVCDEGGECHLQDMTTMCGQVYRRFRFAKRTYKNQYLGPLVNHEMNRCIQCYRCVRFYRDAAGGKDFDVFASKNHLYFGRHEDGVLESEFSGNLVEVCPTGVFTDKTYKRHYTRKWDLESAPSVCAHCGLGCNTIPGARYGTLRRVTARFNGDVNGYFLCDRGRYGYEYVNEPSRLRQPQTGRPDNRADTSWEAALERAQRLIAEGKGVIGVGSPRASLEANYALKKLVGDDCYSTGLSAEEQECAELALSILRDGIARTPSLGEVEDADVVLILGADPTNEAPMLDFAIRQAMRKAPLDIARKLKIPDWDANAVANALQDARGKLYIAAPWRTKLGEVAADSLVAAPVEVAVFADEIAGAVRDSDHARELPAKIATDLLDARRPLLVTTVSLGAEMPKAASNIVNALKDAGKDCWLTIIVPEANTMGVTMLGGMSAGEAMERIAEGKADTLVVLENDLSRRVEPRQYEAAMEAVRRVIVLDCVSTDLAKHADIILPTQAVAETDGTFINNECRAQRFFQAFIPPGDPRPAWWVLGTMAGCFGGLLPKPGPQDPRGVTAESPEWFAYSDVVKEVAGLPGFGPVLEAAPLASWRSVAGRKVPRMPHRYSGRTAQDAVPNVREQSRPPDPNTPFAFSMEGEHNPVQGPLVPRFWSPGWNSNNSVNKFQIEVGGALHGGTPGRRLVEPSGAQSRILPSPKEPSDGSLWLVPRPRIFGSDELSRLAPGIAELTPVTDLAVHPELARRLGLGDGTRVDVEIEGWVASSVVRLDDSVAEDVVSLPTNFGETVGILGPSVCRVSESK